MGQGSSCLLIVYYIPSHTRSYLNVLYHSLYYIIALYYNTRPCYTITLYILFAHIAWQDHYAGMHDALHVRGDTRITRKLWEHTNKVCLDTAMFAGLPGYAGRQVGAKERACEDSRREVEEKGCNFVGLREKGWRCRHQV